MHTFPVPQKVLLLHAWAITGRCTHGLPRGWWIPPVDVEIDGRSPKCVTEKELSQIQAGELIHIALHFNEPLKGQEVQHRDWQTLPEQLQWPSTCQRDVSMRHAERQCFNFHLQPTFICEAAVNSVTPHLALSKNNYSWKVGKEEKS